MTIEEAIAGYIKKYNLPTELNPSKKMNPPFGIAADWVLRAHRCILLTYPNCTLPTFSNCFSPNETTMLLTVEDGSNVYVYHYEWGGLGLYLIRTEILEDG